MKNLFLVIASLFSVNGFAQSNHTDSIHFEGALPKVSPTYKECKVKDTTAIILIINESSHWTKGQYRDYLIFYPKGKIELVESFTPNETSKKRKWKKRTLKNEINSRLWTFLDSCITNELLDLKQSELDRTSKASKTPGRTEVMTVSDSRTYSFAIFRGREYLNYSSYSPESYIRAEYPGIEERKKFLAVINGFEKLIKTVGNKK